MPKTIKLNSGYVMPTLGLGTWQGDRDLIKQAVIEAVKCGYRMIDCAAIYGNQDVIGEALKELFKSGLVKREDLFIVTKLWVTDFTPDRVEKACKASIDSLNIDYIDLYLTHWPVRITQPKEVYDNYNYNNISFNTPDNPTNRLGYSKEMMQETWGEMEKLVDKELVRSIGVSNYSIKKLKELLPTCRIKPAVNQIELHPYLQQWDQVDFAKSHNMFLMAYCPLGRGTSDGSEAAPMNHHSIVSVAQAHNVPPANVLIRWAIQRGTICIPKSTTVTRIQSNENVWGFVLSGTDMDTIKQMDKNKRIVQGSGFFTSGTSWKGMWDGEGLN